MLTVEMVLEGIDTLRKDLADINKSSSRDEGVLDARLKTYLTRAVEQLTALGFSKQADEDFGVNAILRAYGAKPRAKLIDDKLGALRDDVASHPEYYKSKLGLLSQSIPAEPTVPIPQRRSISDAPEPGSPESRNVWVIHGRNLRVRDGIFTFVRTIGLSPIEFSKARKLTGTPTPYIGEILKAAFAHAQAVLVLLTPDDEAKLRREWLQPGDPEWERKLTPQARPNVIFEAGMALASHADRTVLAQFGNIRPFSDVSGLHAVRMDNSAAKRKDLAQRLEDAHCPIDLTGDQWLTAGDLTPPAEPPEENVLLPDSDSNIPTDDETYQLALERWEQLKDPTQKEAVRLLLREDLDTRQALNLLHQKGMAMNSSGVYEGIATTTNFVLKVLPSHPQDEFLYGYTGAWTINPKFKSALQRIVRMEVNR